MTAMNYISPRTGRGSFVWSAGLHFLVAAIVVGAMHLGFGRAQPAEEFMDLAYQTFAEPPAPALEEKRVIKSPEPVTPVKNEPLPTDTAKELQDDKGEVVGTQKAAPQVDVGNASTGTAATTPYYKIKPKYPRSALIEGVEGWVLMQIDINEAGEVENIRVVDGEQRNTFESEAKRAVAQWKYRPFLTAAGLPFRKVDHQVRVDFKLEEHDTSAN